MLLRYAVALSLFAAGAGAWADSLDINLSNKTAQFQYGAGTGSSTQGKSEFHAGILYNNVNSVLGNVGLLITNRLEGAPGLSIGVGIEGLIATIKDNPPNRYNATAVALDGLVRYSPPGASQVGFVGEVHYAPNIITFGDGGRFRQLGARVEFELSPAVMAYVGYRQIKFGLKNNRPDATLDDGAHIGLKLAF
jgi:hypothetical protein